MSALNTGLDTLQYRIVVLTDDTEPFNDLPVHSILLEPRDIAEGMGIHKFHHRMKIACTLRVLHSAEITVHVDTDTIFTQSPQIMFDRLKSNTLAVHVVEATWGGHSSHDHYKLTNNTLSKEGLVSNKTKMINAGVIGIVREDEALLRESLQVMDKYYPLSGKVFCFDQMALSFTAYKKQYKIITCSDVLTHYWSKKRAVSARLTAFFEKHPERPPTRAAFNDISKIKATPPKPNLCSKLLYKIHAFTFPKQIRISALMLLYARHNYSDDLNQRARTFWLNEAIRRHKKRTASGPLFAENNLEELANRLLPVEDAKHFSKILHAQNRADSFA